MTRITLLVARARNGVIGVGNRMPWHIPEELAHFRRTTLGHTLVMGRLTWQSIGRALPGRRTIVLSRAPQALPEAVEQAGSLDEAIARHAAGGGEAELFVVGGAQVFRAALARADRILMTEVDLAPDGDATFDLPDPADWVEVGREPVTTRDGTRYAIVDYRRRRPG